ncbi:hypothetical protein Tco_1081609 [Tanacetum coccineum]|uniref:Uncharacterized protein n=1 Tax=Tanacetum coccineum TaxID=301880 RepID=A0ABQ5HYY7_9ASTR
MNNDIEIIIIESNTSSSSISLSSDEYEDEYDSSSSSGSSCSPYEYEIVSSKGPDKKLFKWYEDTTDEDILKFKILNRKAKGKASSSTTCCDDTSDQEFPHDDDSSDEDFPNDDDSSDEDFLEVHGCKTKCFNSSKTKVVSKPKTVKSPFLDSSDEDMSKSSKSQTKDLKSPFLDSIDEDIPNSSKSQAKTFKGKASYSTAYKTRGSTSSKSKGVPQAITPKKLSSSTNYCEKPNCNKELCHWPGK